MQQYSQAVVLNNLIKNLQGVVNVDYDALYTSMIQITTASGEALDNYGKLLNQPRQISYKPLPKYVWGFDTGTKPSYAGQPPSTFDHGTFMPDYATKIQTLTDDQYRKLLLITYISNSSNSSLYCINLVLQSYFNRGTIYAHTKQDNVLEVVFNFDLEEWEYQIITNPKILPYPQAKKVILRRI